MPRRHTPQPHARFTPFVGCTGKKAYPSEQRAQDQAELLMAQDSSLSLSVYRCTYAPHWHLTRRDRTIYNV